MSSLSARLLISVSLLLVFFFGATIVVLDAAFREAAQQYHPDKVSHLGPELQELANKKFIEIQEAYDVLGKSQKRSEYDQLKDAEKYGFDFGDASFDQLDGAKAMQGFIAQWVAIEGSLIDKDGAIAVEILKPDSLVDGYSALRQSQVYCEIQLCL